MWDRRQGQIGKDGAHFTQKLVNFEINAVIAYVG